MCAHVCANPLLKSMICERLWVARAAQANWWGFHGYKLVEAPWIEKDAVMTSRLRAADGAMDGSRIQLWCELQPMAPCAIPKPWLASSSGTARAIPKRLQTPVTYENRALVAGPKLLQTPATYDLPTATQSSARRRLHATPVPTYSDSCTSTCCGIFLCELRWVILGQLDLHICLGIPLICPHSSTFALESPLSPRL